MASELREQKNGRLYFGHTKADSWMAPNPDAPRDVVSAEEVARVYHYLVAQCPTTKDACGKLRDIRRGYREAKRIARLIGGDDGE